MKRQGLDDWLDRMAWPTASGLTASGIAGIAVIDFASGVELRVYPLYYGPISLAAWTLGRPGASLAAVACALAWLTSNALAGLAFSSPGLWIANTLLHGASFAIVGHLIASLKGTLVRERVLSRTDTLTGLLNSRAFHEEAGLLLALCRRKSRPVTVAYLDLDGFKAVNDQHGHEAGDELLRAVASRLRSSTRPTDLCARIGGDEFAILLPEATHAEATVALERVRNELADTCRGQRTDVTCSVGAVTYLEASVALDEMLRAADERLYLVKTGGKNRVRIDVSEAAGSPR